MLCFRPLRQQVRRWMRYKMQISVSILGIGMLSLSCTNTSNSADNLVSDMSTMITAISSDVDNTLYEAQDLPDFYAQDPAYALPNDGSEEYLKFIQDGITQLSYTNFDTSDACFQAMTELGNEFNAFAADTTEGLGNRLFLETTDMYQTYLQSQQLPAYDFGSAASQNVPEEANSFSPPKVQSETIYRYIQPMRKIRESKNFISLFKKARNQYLDMLKEHFPEDHPSKKVINNKLDTTYTDIKKVEKSLKDLKTGNILYQTFTPATPVNRYGEFLGDRHHFFDASTLFFGSASIKKAIAESTEIILAAINMLETKMLKSLESYNNSVSSLIQSEMEKLGSKIDSYMVSVQGQIKSVYEKQLQSTAALEEMLKNQETIMAYAPHSQYSTVGYAGYYSQGYYSYSAPMNATLSVNPSVSTYATSDANLLYIPGDYTLAYYSKYYDNKSNSYDYDEAYDNLNKTLPLDEKDIEH